MKAPARFIIDEPERAAQTGAADPATSVWVSAHAGAGKTTVLTRRVVRLLMEGVPPSKILCLTYTKAAAANMQNRVFALLAGWVALDDGALANEIADMEGRPPARERLARARRLFAEAVETPGGLRIQTIHAFCERLLHLFPLEANVPAHFEVLDDLQRDALLVASIDGALRKALAAPDSEIGNALVSVADEVTLDTLRGLVATAIRSAGRIGADDPAAALAAHLGLRPGETAEMVQREIVEGGWPPAERERAARVLATSTTNDRKTAAKIAASLSAPSLTERVEEYFAVLFTEKGKEREDVVTKKFANANPHIADALDGEQARIVLLRDRLKSARALERTASLLMLAAEVETRMLREKQRRGLLDFDDLVARTQALLSRAGSAWVLYKLDGGIDHLLVDEAQDTGPEHWSILKGLTGDFFAGASRALQPRSIFAVGDEKQSIYSFQGVDPAQFALAREHYEGLLDGVGPFRAVELKLSFRSTADVLSAVDKVFADPANRQGLAHNDLDAPVHASARLDGPGLVEMWPHLEPPVTPEPDPDDPVDAPAPDHPAVGLARRVAGTIRHWLDTGARFENDGAPIRPGDIKILVQKRSVFFEAVIRALKDAHVPVAGADRLVLTGHIAVQDLIALGRAMLLPQDDLTLGTVLLSPLCGLTDDDLIMLAPGRVGSLWGALAASRDQSHVTAFERLTRWRGIAEGCTPFSFYAAVLGRERMREAMLARLGPDSADPLDAFLSDALAWDERETPSLAAFLDGVLRNGREVKRDPTAGGDAVEVMTIHAAKGLEARIVFLADTFSHPLAQLDGPLLTLAGGGNLPDALVWSPRKGDDPAVVTQARAAREQAKWAEYRRLLYVGMTRARDRLYLAGARGVQTPPSNVWYEMLRGALQPEASEEPADWGGGTVWRWRSGKPAQPLEQFSLTFRQPEPPVPAWMREPAPSERAAEPPLRPSRLFGASEAATRPTARDGDAGARRRGVILHRLFELLPDLAPDERRRAGAHLLALRGVAAEGAEWIETVLRALNDPAIAPLFGAGSRAEVALSGALPTLDGPIAVSARIDRLRVTPEAVLLTDLKTGRPPADTAALPEEILRQLALYRALLIALYPDRPVRAFVLWTALPRLIEADPDSLDEALVTAFPSA